MPLPPSLRFASLPYGKRGRSYPCLVASVTSASDQVQGLQRIYLSDDGRKADLPAPKLSLGKITGGAVRITPPAGVLVLTEGVEDALSAVDLLGQAAWATVGTSNLGKVQFPPVVNTVAIGADNDAAGRAAAEKAQANYLARWLRVKVFFPDPPHKDLNAALLAETNGTRA
jgi:DNA primase